MQAAGGPRGPIGATAQPWIRRLGHSMTLPLTVAPLLSRIAQFGAAAGAAQCCDTSCKALTRHGTVAWRGSATTLLPAGILLLTGHHCHVWLRCPPPILCQLGFCHWRGCAACLGSAGYCGSTGHCGTPSWWDVHRLPGLCAQHCNSSGRCGSAAWRDCAIQHCRAWHSW